MKTISANEFDEKFDNGEDILQYCDLSTARRVYSDVQANVSAKTVSEIVEIDKDLDAKLRKVTAINHISVSAYISNLLKRELV